MASRTRSRSRPVPGLSNAFRQESGPRPGPVPVQDREGVLVGRHRRGVEPLVERAVGIELLEQLEDAAVFDGRGPPDHLEQAVSGNRAHRTGLGGQLPEVHRLGAHQLGPGVDVPAVDGQGVVAADLLGLLQVHGDVAGVPDQEGGKPDAQGLEQLAPLVVDPILGQLIPVSLGLPVPVELEQTVPLGLAHDPGVPERDEAEVLLLGHLRFLGQEG